MVACLFVGESKHPRKIQGPTEQRRKGGVLVGCSLSPRDCHTGVLESGYLPPDKVFFLDLPVHGTFDVLRNSSIDIPPSHIPTAQQPNMIRKQARQRRDYLYRKALILKEAETTEKRAQLRSALASGKPIDPEIAKNKALRKDYQYDESRPDRTVDEEMDLDDEYSQLSGISEPRLLVTVSLFCSSNPGT